MTESNATIAKINNVCNMSQQKHAQQMWAIQEISQLPQKSKTACLLPLKKQGEQRFGAPHCNCAVNK